MLNIHRSERSDVLVEALGDVLSVPLPDALQAEVVSVPTRGVERWLTQRLAHRLGTRGAGAADGVCANLEFPFPGRLVGDAMAAACGVTRDEDPWRPERAVWPLLELLDDCLHEPWLSTLAGHLGGEDSDTGAGGGGDPAGDTRRSRRFSTARHITDLFDRYSVHRPAMIRAWSNGHDVLGSGRPLAVERTWQPELWRRLRDRIGTGGPAERLEGACAALAADADLVDLPARLALFGLTRLPASYLDVLRALARQREVHLFLLHPSGVLWSRISDVTPAVGSIVSRAEDPTVAAPANPLLKSWGRDSREMQLVLSAGDHPVIDNHRSLRADEATTLLGRVQQAVRDDVEPPGDRRPGEVDLRPVLDVGDRSLQVHACHGRARQVEVMRDAILHLLVEDPTLEPRDVIAMCPDIETFAPLIHATFGAGDPLGEEDEEPATDAGGPPDLRVRLADRSLRQTNPVLGALSNLLLMADARVTATQVLDFAGRDPVRRRFRFDDDDLARMKEWASATNIRWGLDAEHRAPFKLDRVDQNTWRSGLDRVLAGVAMAEEQQRLMGGVLPLDDVDSGSIDLAGRTAEFVDRLHGALLSLRGPMAVSDWAAAIAEAANGLMATTERDAWQRGQLQRLVDEMVEEATVEGIASGTELALSEVRALLGDRLKGRPTRANFRTGHLTVCTLVPMRSVPHRVVCLLGLDDGAFPRQSEPDGDDLVAAEAWVGDGDGRSDDRQLLLDALLSATERLVITYSGNDERTNAPLPPAVPVGELLDVIDATVRPAAGGGGSARQQVVVHHPLQPFDPRNFEPGFLVREDPWSFDPLTLEGARAMLSERPPAPPFLPTRLPRPPRSEVIELDGLVRFVQHPVRAFLRQRLGISVGDFSDEIIDVMPVDLDALEKWSIGERVLMARLAGATPEQCAIAERARGALPPGALANDLFAEVASIVECLVTEAEAIGTRRSEVDSVEVSVRLDDGRLVAGTVPGIIGSVARSVTYSRLGPKHRLPAWVRFLALSAGRPDHGFEVVTVGRAQSGNRRCEVSMSRFAPLSHEPAKAEVMARGHLHDLVDLYDRGLCEPLPIFCSTSAAFVAAAQNGKDPIAAASKVWVSEYPTFAGEDRQAEHLLVLGGAVAPENLFAEAPHADEEGDGWEASEETRFGRYARRLWTAALAAEELSHK